VSSNGNRVVFRGEKKELHTKKTTPAVIKVVSNDSSFDVEQIQNEHRILSKLSPLLSAPGIQLQSILPKSTRRLISDYIGRPIPRIVISDSLPTNKMIALITRPFGESPLSFLAFHHDEFPPSSPTRLAMLVSSWLIEAIHAISFLHEHGIIHRDIKPSNMILVGSGPQRIRLIDFGVACSMGDVVESAGTFEYASDGARREQPPTFRDDWESLCYTFYSLYVGNERYLSEERPSIDSILTLFPSLRSIMSSS